MKDLKNLTTSEFVVLIKESVKKQVTELKGKSTDDKIKQAQALLKIVDEQARTYDSLAKEAEKLYKKTEYSDIKKEGEELAAKCEEKKALYKKIEEKIKTLQAEAKGAKTPQKKTIEEVQFEDNSIPIIAKSIKTGKKTEFSSIAKAARTLFIKEKSIHSYFKSVKKSPIESEKLDDSFSFSHKSIKK